MTEKIYTELDEQGFSRQDGWLTLYHYQPQSGEFSHSEEEFRPAGVGLPAHATDIKPMRKKKGFAVCFNGKKWCYVPDHRGTVVYNIETGQAKTLDQPGEIGEQYTTLAPAGEFDRWDGEQWQTDIQAQQQAAIEQAEQQKQALEALAQQKISLLQDALELGIALEGDQDKLKGWRAFRVLLDRIDTNKPDRINWPAQPH